MILFLCLSSSRQTRSLRWRYRYSGRRLLRLTQAARRAVQPPEDPLRVATSPPPSPILSFATPPPSAPLPPSTIPAPLHPSRVLAAPHAPTPTPRTQTTSTVGAPPPCLPPLPTPSFHPSSPTTLPPLLRTPTSPSSPPLRRSENPRKLQRSRPASAALHRTTTVSTAPSHVGGRTRWKHCVRTRWGEVTIGASSGRR